MGKCRNCSKRLLGYENSQVATANGSGGDTTDCLQQGAKAREKPRTSRAFGSTQVHWGAKKVTHTPRTGYTL